MGSSQLEQLDVNLILALHWLLSEQSVSAAAEKMSVTQPAMSRSLARLREMFHDPILVKAGRGMAMTPRAEALAPTVAEAVEKLRDVMRQNHEFDPAEQSGLITVASVDYLSVHVVDAWSKAIAPHAPNLKLQLESIKMETIHDLITGKTDFTIFPDLILRKLPPTVDTEQFVRRDLFTQHFYTAVRKGHPLADKTMTLKRFLSAKHIMINPEGDRSGMVDDQLAGLGERREVDYYTHSFLSAVSIVRKTDCILTASSGIFEQDSRGLVFFEPPIPMPSLHFLASWHPNWTPDPRHKWVRDRLLPQLSKHTEKKIADLVQ